MTKSGSAHALAHQGLDEKPVPILSQRIMPTSRRARLSASEKFFILQMVRRELEKKSRYLLCPPLSLNEQPFFKGFETSIEFGQERATPEIQRPAQPNRIVGRERFIEQHRIDDPFGRRNQ